VKEIAGLAIEIVGVDDANLDYVRQAAIYKATRKLSYADSFAAALAKIRDAQLITGDREFKQVEDEIDIDWLR
jgi:predicted nucleic acid-binding protein